MGRKRATAKPRARAVKSLGGGSQAAGEEKRALIRRLLTEGFSEPTIVRQLAHGVDVRSQKEIDAAVPPRIYNGADQRSQAEIDAAVPPRILKCQPAMTYRHLQILGEEWRGLHDSPEVQERVFGATIEALQRIARKAEQAGKYQQAIHAWMSVARLYGLRSARWAEASHMAAEGGSGKAIAQDTALATRARELAALSDAELRTKLDELTTRTAHLRLLQGGKAAG